MTRIPGANSDPTGGPDAAPRDRAAERKSVESEERWRLAADALRESEERVRLLLDSTAEAILGLDLDGRCTFVNAACLRILGYSRPEDILEHEMHPLVHHTRADGSPYPVEECPSNRASRFGERSHTEHEVLWRKDGSSFPAEYWSYPIVRNGTMVGSVVTFLDITERRSLEEQFRHAQRMEAVGRLAGGVAHDFNNLLTVIGGYGELLLTSIPRGDPNRAALEEIVTAGERAASLTRQLLAFSRKQVLAPEVLDLNVIVAGMDKMLRRLIGEDIALVSVPAADLSRVRADPGQIEQVIMNLAVNARDAMPTGGRLTIETRNATLAEGSARVSLPPGSYVLLTVCDTGTGMTAQTMEHIFEPFFTTKEQGKGTGLGLATVHGIIRQSGGDVAVESAPGKGATFEIYLPPVEVDERSPESPSGVLRAVPRGSQTILLVEDEKPVRTLCRAVLEALGYAVLEATDAEDALKAVATRTGPIHLLVTDIVMPGVGGPELARQFGSLLPGARVLFVSGYSDEAVMRGGVIKSGAAFLQKPFSPASLARKVREVLDEPPSLPGPPGGDAGRSL